MVLAFCLFSHRLFSNSSFSTTLFIAIILYCLMLWNMLTALSICSILYTTQHFYPTCSTCTSPSIFTFRTLPSICTLLTIYTQPNICTLPSLCTLPTVPSTLGFVEMFTDQTSRQSLLN